MTSRSLFLLTGTAAVLWVVPSVGTQGMGTIGARVIHPDADLVDTLPTARPAARATLTRADEVAEAAIGLP